MSGLEDRRRCFRSRTTHEGRSRSSDRTEGDCDHGWSGLCTEITEWIGMTVADGARAPKRRSISSWSAIKCDDLRLRIGIASPWAGQSQAGPTILDPDRI